MWIAFVISLFVSVGVAAFVVWSEVRRAKKNPPSPVFSMDEAYDWVVAKLPDLVAATLTPEDVRKILQLQMLYLKAKGAVANGNTSHSENPVMIGGSEIVEFIIEQAGNDGLDLIPEQVHTLIEIQIDYLIEIGAIVPPASDN